MRPFVLLVIALASSLSVSADAAERPNVLLICVDDLRPELACYGKDYIQSPNIDRLAGEGVLFQRHFVQAPTCGASRFAMLTGNYGGASNNALFQRAATIASGQETTDSMPAWFRKNGYRTVSVGKVSHHPGGRGGKDWDDPAQPEMPNSWDEHLHPSGDWQHPRGAMHGLANGEIRGDASKMALIQSTKGDDTIYPDGLTTILASQKIGELSKDTKPFFLAVGLLKPHLPFGAPAKYMQPYLDASLPKTPHAAKPDGRTTWHRSGEFMKYNRSGRNPNTDAEYADIVRKHYAACVTYSDAMIGAILQTLRDSGQYENTIIVVWGDHGWHLGEHAIWGKHALFEESLHSPLIIRHPKLQAGLRINDVVESVDIFPTLCELAGLDVPSIDGVSLLAASGADEKPNAGTAISYTGSAATIRSGDYRLILHKKDNFAELYDQGADYASDAVPNIAEQHPDVVERLTQELNSQLKR